MKVVVLSSGSKGNTTYVETVGTKLLIDAGNSCKYITDKLNNLGVNPSEIDGILITHTHVDHVKGLKTFLNKYHLKVFLTSLMYEELNYVDNYEIVDNSNIKINDIDIDIIKTSHDTPDSVGFVISCDNKSLVYITDTGYINKKYYSRLTNKSIYIFESNHDVEMLNNSSYPFQLRQRILSDKGHLSNYDSARYLDKFIGINTKYIFLAHLSEENNTKELALKCLEDRIMTKKDNVNIIIASQNEETDLVEV